MRDRVAKQVVTTAIPPEALDAIKIKAKAENRSVSQTICLLLQCALEQAAQQQPSTLAEANQISS